MTKYQQFVERWKDGCGSTICEQAASKCFARGRIPATVLFVGEAPGASEDALGTCFVGPAGKLLDQIIERTIPKEVSWCLCNLVCCFPIEAKRAGNHEPPKEAIEACATRLREFITMASPKLIVCVGGLAEKWVPRITAEMIKHPGVKPVQWCAILHPAFILSRLHPTAQPLAVQKCIVTIADAVEELS